MISLFRIDDRLLHGQVAFGWSPAVQANVILIVNDEAKNDKVKAMALDLAKPNNVKLYIRGVKESGEIVSKFAEAKKSNVVVLVRNTNDALEVIRNANGVVTELNVGGLRYEEGKQKLTDLIAVSDQDLDNFKKIENLGVNIDFRILPRDKKQLLGDLVKNWS